MATLRSVVAELQQISLELLAAPADWDPDVGDPVLFDPADDGGFQPGDVVLGIGVDAAAATRMLRQLAAAGAVALVLKLAGPPPESLTTAAVDAGVAILTAPTSVTWGQLYSLLRTASTAGADPRRGDAPIGDLFALADAVAAMAGGATTIEDPTSRVLAYSNLDHPIDAARQESILGRQVSPEWLRRLNEAGVFRQLWYGDDVVDVGELGVPDVRHRMAIAVRAGGEILGSIWVCEGDQPFGPKTADALREGARLAAIHLLRHRSSADVDRQRRAEALRGLLEGTGSVSAAASVLGIEPNGPVTVIALAQDGSDEAEAEVRAQRAADLIALYCESYRRRAACVPVRGTVYVLLPGAEPGGPERVATLAESMVARAKEALHVELRGGIGTTVPALADVATSRREADQAAGALAGDPRRRAVAHIDAVRSRAVLAELAVLAERMPELRAGRLAVLAEHDAEHGTAYLPTLRAYLDAFGDVALAAGLVNVHPNTFRYRLKRLGAISGLDLDDPDERLVVALQLRLAAGTGLLPPK